MEIRNKKIHEAIKILSEFLHGKEKAIRLTFIAFFSKGHLLIEDLPGLGKTTLAIGISKILGLKFGRIQCTSDLLPSDIIGVKIYNKATQQFEFHKGPIFNNVVLVDEINRATPKTQSALLEAMGEKQVTVDGETYELPKPFFVIATQNPLEQYGTFPLPEAQMDRFLMKISLGYPSREAEKEIIKGGSKREEIYKLKPLFTREEILEIQEDIDKIYIDEKVINYILDIVEATRNHKMIAAGVSVRGTLAIAKTGKTNAYFKGRDFVVPDDIKELALYTIPHRIVLKEEYEHIPKEEIIKTILEEIVVPVV